MFTKWLFCSCAGIVFALALADAHDPITTRVTWNGEISRIVEARCIKCHAPDGPGPMSLTTYDAARPWARAIKEETLTRRMPKWQAVRGYGDFRNDPSLSAFEIALISAWVDGGAPRGTDGETRQKEQRPRPERGAKSPSESEGGWGPPSAEKSGQNAREIAVPCGERPLPEGTLVAVRPNLEKDQSVGIAVRFPNGRREIIAWIRGFDPKFPTTYWLRAPMALPPGSVLTTEPPDRCSVNVTITARRQ
jgi:hypothetical protein